MSTTLLQIQKLQFSDRTAAEATLLEFLKQSYDGSVKSVSINTKPESLNSVNGIVELQSGARYFFKTHTEENEQITDYYNSRMLGDAGYPMLQPTRIEHKPGQQIALYEVISLPTLFDEIKKVEDEILLSPQRQCPTGERLVKLNAELDRKVFECYKETLDTQIRTTAKAPVHQLFSHRLAAEGRIDLFYTGKTTVIDGKQIAFADLAQLKWTVNAVEYAQPLSELIEQARQVLKRNLETVSVVGHGDAHNGNLFVDYAKDRLFYFDPAFAGRHSPFLDLVKPIFHNVFARWMYFPDSVSKEFDLTYKISTGSIEVEHNFVPSPIRQQFLSSKIKNTLHPITRHLEKKNALPGEWRELMRSALFCCPFLTVNLFSPANPQGSLAERYDSKIKLLGLSMSVAMAADVIAGKSSISEAVDKLFD